MAEEGRTRVALVTGAASGIGAATARRLAPEARLVLVDRDKRRLAQLAESLLLPDPDVLQCCHDVTDSAAWTTIEAAIRERFGRLDLAVANAGIAAGGPIEQTAFKDWRRVMSVNLDGTFLTLRCALRLIRAAGRGGSIVVVASASAIKAEAGAAAYAASKAGAVQLAKVAAREAAPYGIRVNAVLPGGVKTAMWRAQPFFADLVERTGSEEAAFAALAEAATPLGRFAEPVEVADQIAYLLSERAAAMTGAAVAIDGGYSA